MRTAVAQLGAPWNIVTLCRATPSDATAACVMLCPLSAPLACCSGATLAVSTAAPAPAPAPAPVTAASPLPLARLSDVAPASSSLPAPTLTSSVAAVQPTDTSLSAGSTARVTTRVWRLPDNDPNAAHRQRCWDSRKRTRAARGTTVHSPQAMAPTRGCPYDLDTGIGSSFGATSTYVSHLESAYRPRS